MIISALRTSTGNMAMAKVVDGTGTLSVNGKASPVSYRMHFEEQGGTSPAWGTLTAPSRLTLINAAMADGCELRLQTGEVVEVIVENTTISDVSSAKFKVLPARE